MRFIRGLFRLRLSVVDASIFAMCAEFVGFSNFELWHFFIGLVGCIFGLFVSTVVGNALGVRQTP